MGLNFGVSLSGILASQTGIKVTQNNIANMGTTSYARQEVNLVVNTSKAGGGVEAQIGNGVWVQEVTRVKDEFLITQMRNEQSTMHYYQSMKEELANVEGIFNETSSGSISNMLTKFFNAWEDLSKYPEENSYRNALVANAKSLASKFTDVNQGLNETKAKLDEDITIQVKKINELVGKIAGINEKLTKNPTDTPNSLFDERDRYLDELATYANVQVSQDVKNPLLVNVKVGGVSVVSGSKASTIHAMHDQQNDEWVVASGNVEMHFTGGSLAGDLQMRNGHITNYQQQVDQFVQQFIQEVNDIHAGGFGLDGTTGEPFFVGTGLHNIAVNPIFEKNPEKIATATSATASGNADIAKQIAALKDKAFLAGGTANPISFYNGFAIGLATELNIIKDNQSIHAALLVDAQTQRQSVQGVNMDEELTNLMQWQQTFASNSKVITVVDKLYDTLLQMI